MHILVCGEALVDVVPVPGSNPSKTRSIPGGSPYNVAVGLARLGVPTGFLGKISTDESGVRLIDHLRRQRVETSHIVRTRRPTTVARVTTTPGAEPDYAFEIEGTADRSLRLDEIPKSLPEHVRALHFGSYSLALEPTAGALEALMTRERERRVVSLDPNIRPRLVVDPAAYRRRLKHGFASAHIIKLSESDLAWIDPQKRFERAARRWLKARAELVVFTRGSKGAIAYTTKGTIEFPSLDVEVVDTVGAGDAFMSGLLATLYNLDRLDSVTIGHLSRDDVRHALDRASQAAAITCSRQGANPPTSCDLEKHPR